MNEIPTLKPCPFCGNTDINIVKISVYGTQVDYFVKCSKCKHKTRHFLTGNTKQMLWGKNLPPYITDTMAIEKAINLWNTRVND